MQEKAKENEKTLNLYKTLCLIRGKSAVPFARVH